MNKKKFFSQRKIELKKKKNSFESFSHQNSEVIIQQLNSENLISQIISGLIGVGGIKTSQACSEQSGLNFSHQNICDSVLQNSFQPKKLYERRKFSVFSSQLFRKKLTLVHRFKKQFVKSSGKTIRLWDVKTGTLKQQLNGHTNFVKPVCISLDGTILASGSCDQTIRVWNANTGTFQYQLDEHTQHVWSLSFSPNGATLASGSYDETIRLWDAKTGAFKQQLVGHTGTVYSAYFSPNETILAMIIHHKN